MIIYSDGKICALGVGYIGGAHSSNDIYSTEEQVVGTWINGKPIYRKVFQMTTASSPTTNAYYSVSDLNIDEMTLTRGRLYVTGNNGHEYQILIPATLAGYELCLNFDKTAGNVVLWHKSADHNSLPVTVIIEYTKTTDEAATTLSSDNISETSEIPTTFTPTSAAQFSL